MAGKMTIEEQEQVLQHWASLDSKMTDEDREECIDAIANSEWTKAEWLDYLYPVPANVGERYRKALRAMQDKKLLDEDDVQASLAQLANLSPVRIAKEIVFLREWYREEQLRNFPTLRGAF
jgi:hypothetical protein